MKRITKIDAAAKETKKLCVAAYARVTTDSADQLVSLEAQKEHYEQVIKNCPNWEFAGLYYDEGVSGTKMAKRDGLLRMLADCERGLIDYILVKSISRFSRNTVESVETVRRLSAMGIYIFFEKENIDTGKMEGELMLSIMSSLAEDESRSLSENNKWSIQKRFQNGTYVIGTPAYGYKNADGKMVIDEEKAEVVRRIFDSVLEGKSGGTIAKELNAKGIPTARGVQWRGSVITAMIRNETYTGVAVFQKTYKDDEFNSHVNHGERGMYRIEGHHDPIVSEEVFLAANTAVDNNAKEKGVVRNSGKYSVRYALSGKIFCGECGGKCKRKKIYGDIRYGCETHARESKKCRQLPVRADMIEAAFVNMMNKLIYGRDAVLLPMSGRLLGGGDKEIIDRLAEINTELDAIAERRQAADKFFAKGLLDAAVYREELDELARKEKELHTVRAGIEGDPNLDSDRQRALNELLRYTAKAELLTAFSDEVFTKHVDRVIIFSRKEVGFAMKCGPVFRERI